MGQLIPSFKTSGAHHILHIQHKSNDMSDCYALVNQAAPHPADTVFFLQLIYSKSLHFIYTDV